MAITLPHGPAIGRGSINPLIRGGLGPRETNPGAPADTSRTRREARGDRPPAGLAVFEGRADPSGAQAARTTLPALRHLAQTLRRFGAPATTARTRWMFGFQRRFVRMCECEMLCPKLGPLPQTSQLAATVSTDR